MSARARAAEAARKHLVVSGIGFAAALGFVKLTFPSAPVSSETADAPSSSGSGSSGSEGGRSTGSASSSNPGGHPGSSPGPSSKDELQLVQVVFRHGARTPLARRYWRDWNPVWDVCGKGFPLAVPVAVLTEDGRPRPPNPDDQKQVDEKYEGGCHKGQLTLVGEQQALDFGRYLRWRYHMVHSLLPDTWQDGTVVARTTSYQRTIATLQGVLSGLFPGTRQPIPVHTTEEIDEILYTNVKSCRKLHTLLTGLQAQLKEAHHPRDDVHERAEALQQQVHAALGLPADHRVHWVDLHDAVTTALTHGKTVPAGLNQRELLRGINQLATARFMHVIAPHPETGKQEEVLRLGMGVLMEMMVQRMEAAAAGANSDVKLYLYSGHDSSVMPLLAALGKHVQDWPPYLSNLIFELWRRPSGQQYVKVLYNKEELPLTELCGAPACDLQLFKEKVLGAYLLTRDQHQKECLLHFLHDKPAGEHTETEEVAVGSSFQDSAAGAAGAADAASTAAATPAAGAAGSGSSSGGGGGAAAGSNGGTAAEA